jgi:hypothetical protein
MQMRRRTTLATFGAAVLAGCTVAAQAAGQPGSTQTQRKDGEAVTVDGCLSVNPAAKTYILTVRPDEVASAAPGAANKTTTITYQLVGGDGLQRHVGDRVEVTGRIQPDTTATARSESERSDAPRNPQEGEAKPTIETKTETKIRAQVLRVQSFRFMEGNCKPTDR